MNQPSHPEGTRAGTFKPDWEAIRKVSKGPFYGVPFSSDTQYHAHICQAMAAEWNRQVAAAGYVMVRREDLLVLRRCAMNLERRNHHLRLSADAEQAMARTALVVKPEPAPGGDAG